MDESQAGINIAGRNINNLRYAYYTTLMDESEEELNSLLMRVEEGKNWLKLKIQNMEKEWKQWGTLFSWAPKSLQMVTAAMKIKDAWSLEEKLSNLNSVLKSRDIAWPTKVHIVKVDFSSNHVPMWDLDHKERWLDNIIYPMDMNLSKLWETVEDSRIWCDSVHRVTESHLTDRRKQKRGKESHWLVQ